MPPVMGAAAFLMVEYVGIPYSEIIRHAFIPAVISYIALFYIVHLEAMRLGMEPMAKVRQRTAGAALLSWALGLAGTIAACRCDLLRRDRHADGSSAPRLRGFSARC